MRKPAFCVCENKDADHLLGYREADLRLCFRYTDSKIPLPIKSEISSLKASSVAVQPGLCRSWSETPKTDGFSHKEAHIKHDFQKLVAVKVDHQHLPHHALNTTTMTNASKLKML